jgi:UDP-N-acetylmuramoylalanine--D-glutamate ligase
MKAYADAKRRIFYGQGLMVLNADDPMVDVMVEPGRRCVRFSVKPDSPAEYRVDKFEGQEWLLCQGERLLPVNEVRIKGRHNIANALAAVALGDEAGLARTAMAQALREFAGLDHRMQWVAEVDGVAYINDSKATNVGACIAALDGLDAPVVLIAGGDGKGADFSVLADVVAAKVRAIVLMGRDAPLLQQALGHLVETVHVETMKQAVAAARRLALRGDIVLLAPACASLDQYKDYKERGRMFAEAVRGLS